MHPTYYTFDSATGNLLDDDGDIAFGTKFSSADEADDFLINNDIPGAVRSTPCFREKAAERSSAYI